MSLKTTQLVGRTGRRRIRVPLKQLLAALALLSFLMLPEGGHGGACPHCEVIRGVIASL